MMFSAGERLSGAKERHGGHREHEESACMRKRNDKLSLSNKCFLSQSFTVIADALFSTWVYLGLSHATCLLGKTLP